jgi:hypothetical protein
MEAKLTFELEIDQEFAIEEAFKRYLVTNRIPFSQCESYTLADKIESIVKLKLKDFSFDGEETLADVGIYVLQTSVDLERGGGQSSGQHHGGAADEAGAIPPPPMPA